MGSLANQVQSGILTGIFIAIWIVLGCVIALNIFMAVDVFLMLK